MRFRLAVTLVAALALCFAAVAEAQQPGGRRGGPGGFGGGFGGGMGGFGGVNRLALLRISEVREELNLTEEQVAALEKFEEEQRAARRGGPGRRGGGEGQPRGRRGNRDNQTNAQGAADWYFVQQEQPGGRRGGQLTPEQLEQFRQAAEERAKVEREKLAEILLPNQLKRLNQIYVQVAGTAALNDADIAKELNITDEQREKMASVRRENAESMGAQMRELFQSGDREQIQAKMAELRKAGDEKVLAVLNDEQKKKFEEMKGEKFDLPEGALRGGFGGFGGFGGGRGGPGGEGGRRGGRRGND